MEKARNLIGLPVLELKNGTQIGEVVEVVVNLVQARICGVAVSIATWFGREEGIVFADIFSIGQDAVTVNNSGVIQDFELLMKESESYYLGQLCEKPVYTETGDFLGVLVDIGFDSATGEARFFELSDGLITDFVYGRLWMPLPRAQIIQEDKLVVPGCMSKLVHKVN